MDAPTAVKGYKVFDNNWRCQDFQYEVGKVYTHQGPLTICESGFHFCKNAADCFKYKTFEPLNKCAEVEALGDVIDSEDKCVTNKIRIVREITWHEMLELCNDGQGNTGYNNKGNQNSGNNNYGNHNTGHANVGSYNSGYGNSGSRNCGQHNAGSCNTGDINLGFKNAGSGNVGDRNAGNRNIGHCNSGDWNSGNWNSGDWNSGDHNAGYFNTIDGPILMFNKPTDVPLKDIKFPVFLDWVRPYKWIPFSFMTDEEIVAHPKCEHDGGYLKQLSYKEAMQEAIELSIECGTWKVEKAKLLALPNFDYAIFEQITGISKADLDEYDEKNKQEQQG